MQRIIILAIVCVVAVVAYMQFNQHDELIPAVALQTDPAPAAPKIVPRADGKTLAADAFKTIEWIDLMPKDDLEALLNPPDYLAEIEDGSVNDKIDSELGSSIDAPEDRYQQALVSQRIIPEYDGQAVRIPGFVVPLEFGEDQKVTQFFLVPFFGACIHLPPPPPNQIIYINHPEGVEFNSTYVPYWISGVVKTELIENDLAVSAYSLSLHHVEDYEEISY